MNVIDNNCDADEDDVDDDEIIMIRCDDDTDIENNVALVHLLCISIYIYILLYT